MHLLITNAAFLEGPVFELAAPQAVVPAENQTNETEMLLLPREKIFPATCSAVEKG